MMAQQHTELDNIRRRLQRGSSDDSDRPLSPPPFG
jgi:hypothetical protein